MGQALTRKEQARYRAIVKRLDSIRKKGFSRFDHPDVELLESELAALADKMTKQAETGTL